MSFARAACPSSIIGARIALGIGALVALGIGALGTGCGYTFQNSHSPLLEKEDVHRLYIAPLVNNTYKIGVENLVYNALLRAISSGRRVSLVSSPEFSDAVLAGTVTEADTNGLAAGTQVGNRLISSQYNATLSCTFRLIRRNPHAGQRGVIWSAAFTRVKPFASAFQPGGRGETAALINDSQFDRSLTDLASSMVADIHESMLAMF